MLMDEAEHDRGGEKRSDCEGGDQGDGDDGTCTKECKSEQASSASDSFNAASPSASSCPAPINGDFGLLVPKCEPEEIVCAVDCADGLCPTHIDPYESNADPYFPKCEMEELGIAVEGSSGPTLAGPPRKYLFNPSHRSITLQKYAYDQRGEVRYDVDAHERTHNGVKPFVCDVCNRGFVQRSQLHVHQKSHSGERPHECLECGKRFVLLSHLNYHRNNVHNKADKPHVCPQCGRGFVRRAVLNRHMLSHETRKPYVCSVCGRTFSRMDNAKTHFWRKHSETDGVIYTRPVTSVSSSVSEGACSYSTSNDGQEEQSSVLYDRATPHILGVAGVLETADTSNLHALSRP
ncbi:hypothetical protein HPB50_004320 [Hyalomma asiaticum]|uniref:Uncharacterized protein n=1 Tax=Hyalomma asiaticum TaxID=266040 RepID=A0ACB7RQH7_HYAAI|nr:hypothetical protein HPB50_004320 [Hyalomma asiaticum]